MHETTPISRRMFAKGIATGVGGALLSPLWSNRAAAIEAAPAGAPDDRARPNVVFIVSDQHSYKYAGFMGHPIVETPNLDRIAKRGAVFRQTYCGSPVCTPSRASLMSGAYPSDCDSFCNATVWNGAVPTWPKLLRDAGYHTFATGKMDIDPAFDLGLVEQTGVTHGHASDPDVTAFFRRPLCSRIDERRLVDGRARTKAHHDATVFGNTVNFIRSRAQKNEPWLAYCGGNMPHPGFIGLQEHYEKYLARIDDPIVPAGQLEELHWVYRQLRHFKDIATPIPIERVRRARAAYYAMITEVDHYVGQVWSALEETGQLDHTIFIYTSDHGEALGEHGLWFKNNLFESAARVPLVIAGPGIAAGTVIETPIAQVDLVRTIVEWTGAKPHEKLRGESLTPLLHGQTGSHRGWVYTESHSEGNETGSFMLRKGDWKYIHFVWHEGLLFNLADDPAELKNRFHDPAVQPILKELRALLEAQVALVPIAERAFAAQRQAMDRMAQRLKEQGMLDELRDRLGEGQSLSLLTTYYGHTFSYEHKAAKKTDH